VQCHAGKVNDRRSTVMAHLGSRPVLASAAATAALALRAPVRVDAQRATFTSGVDLVPLTVWVTDPAGKYVTGLYGSDFNLFEVGVEQPLSFFALDDVPVDVALVLDTSTSMRADLPLVQLAASGLVRSLRDCDRGAVVEVNDIAAFPHGFTSDRSRIDAAIRALSISGSTALYDGLYIVLKEFARERAGAAEIRRQALVLLSDGIDTSSRLAFDDVMDLVRRAGVSVYVIALRDEIAFVPRADLDGSVLRAEYALSAVARESGGRVFFPKSARELPAVYTAIARELSSQYELGYTPARSAGDGTFRRVMVRVSPATNALARTRSGYYAAPIRRGV
jgi:Ca-activated chloride channel family protein